MVCLLLYTGKLREWAVLIGKEAERVEIEVRWACHCEGYWVILWTWSRGRGAGRRRRDGKEEEKETKEERLCALVADDGFHLPGRLCGLNGVCFWGEKCSRICSVLGYEYLKEDTLSGLRVGVMSQLH